MNDPPTRAPALAFLSQLGSRIMVAAGIWVRVSTMFVHLQFFILSSLFWSNLLAVCLVCVVLQSGFEGSPCVGRHVHI